MRPAGAGPLTPLMDGNLTMTLQIGDPAPDFTVRDATGRGEISLSDFAGRAVVLSLYPLAFTPG